MIRNFFLSLKRWLFSRRIFAVLDPSDNSVTLSHALLSHMKEHAPSARAAVLVSRLTDGSGYAFTVTPDVPEGTPMADIQYNVGCRCTGFEMFSPTVARVFYDYGLPADKAVVLAVTPVRMGGTYYYRFEKPL